MDYTKLAEEFMQCMLQLKRHRPQRKISDSMHGETFVLQYISMQGGDVIPSEISAEMEISTARIAVALGSLENKRLITRQIDPGDRRRIRVRLTELGRKQVEKHRQSMLGMVAGMLSGLGERDAGEYVRITARLSQMEPQWPESDTQECATSNTNNQTEE